MISQHKLRLDILFFVLTLYSVFNAHHVLSKRLPVIHWNSNNSIFDVSNTDHVIGAEIDDRVSIHCPSPAPVDEFEFSNIYMVSEDEYNHCVLLNPHFIGSCNNETKKDFSIQLVFRHFSPVPGGLEFVPGRKYFMISTSNGKLEGIANKKGGLCEKKQMKIKFEIHPRRDQVNPKFAARTLTRDDSPTTPVMYIIHNEDDSGNDDDSSTSISLPILLLLTIMIRQIL
ncbi:unnamed protein product [Auanema sp. JU1783]|nr:unnamed protein product [Auanema sp. JU1783]